MEGDKVEYGSALVEATSEECTCCGGGPVIHVEVLVAECLRLHGTFCHNCRHIERWETHR